jgi:group I intron endonuclease
MDYQNGKIYKILNTIDDDCYIGSTTQPLSKRMVKHRSNVHGEATKDRLLYIKMRIHGVENFYIELVEEYPCENIEQLRQREGQYIRELGTLNHYIAGRSKQQHVLDNMEHNREVGKRYYEENKEQVLQRNKKYYTKNKEQVLQQQNKYYTEHNEKIKEWRSTRVQCSCGSHYTLSHKSSHMKSLRHKTHVEQQQPSGQPE